MTMTRQAQTLTLAQRVQQLQDGTASNYIFPFFWQHGEDEATLRHYMRVIHAANIGAVCVESRPHPDFAGPKWWADLDAILDEAGALSMQVWILDDQHFPTGYAAGAVEQAPSALCHQYLSHNTLTVCGPKPCAAFDIARYAKPQPTPPWFPPQPAPKRIFGNDAVLCVLASPVQEGGLYGAAIDLTPLCSGDALCWDVPQGLWKVDVIYTTRDANGRNDYINLLDAASCRLLLDAVYESHYARYRHLFGTVIAGFFSDEPPVGNTPGYTPGDLIGKPDMPLSWSTAMPSAMQCEYGNGWQQQLALLWAGGADTQATARIRVAYMNAVSKLVEACFSRQIGDWCEARGVEYIGHMLEDCDSSANLGPSMGHFFRGLAGQHMAGIDNIGGQVMPGGQHAQRRPGGMCQDDAGFYHYMLGRMGASMAAVQANKKGRCLCENFGAYGWQTGVRTEKYLTDHFLARGINRFVPHAFTPKAFPDPDCPPHFYAHGENAQYRAFGALMAYTNRVCHLIDGGTAEAPVALLYHGESQWAGAYESNIHACRALTREQYGFLLIPCDALALPEEYRTVYDPATKTLTINGTVCRALVISGCDYLPRVAAEFVVRAQSDGFPVLFTQRVPQGVSDAACDAAAPIAAALAARLSNDTAVPAAQLPQALAAFGIAPLVRLEAPFPDCTVYHYRHTDGGSVFLLLNESPWDSFTQTVALPMPTDTSVFNAALLENGSVVGYDAWNNRFVPVSAHRESTPQDGVHIGVRLALAPLEMAVILCGVAPSALRAVSDAQDPAPCAAHALGLPVAGFAAPPSAPTSPNPGGAPLPSTLTLDSFTVARATGKTHPVYSTPESADLLHGMQQRYPDFSGWLRYETCVLLPACTAAVLTLPDAYECAEVFVNGQSAGLCTAQPYRYDLTALLAQEEHNPREIALVIEVATTPERHLAAQGVDVACMHPHAPLSPTGLVGAPTLTFLKADAVTHAASCETEAACHG